MFVNEKDVEERENDNAVEDIISEAMYLTMKWHEINAQMKNLILGTLDQWNREGRVQADSLMMQR